MKRLLIPSTSVAIVLVMVLISIITANAQRINDLSALQSSYDMSWYTIDGSAIFSTGSGYSLNGTVGQPEVGTLSGGGYTLNAGFWGGASIASYTVYLPLVRK